MNTNTYLDRLKKRQGDEGWSDREMARQVGVSPATWTRIKRGERGMGIDVLQMAMRRFPEYDTDALLFLRSDVSNCNTSVVREKQETTNAA